MRAASLAIVVVLAGRMEAAGAVEQTVSAGRIVEAARAALPTCSCKEMSLTARVIGAPVSAVVPAGAVSLHALAPAGRWPRARVAMPVEIVIDGRQVRSETVWFAVKAERQGFVYAGNDAVGTSADKLVFRKARVDVAAADGAPVETIQQVANERLKRGVHQGWPVLKSDFEPIPDVDKNARVVVHVRYGAIRMQAVATALQAGDTGDTVSILVEGAQSPVQARVEAKGVVDIAR